MQHSNTQPSTTPRTPRTLQHAACSRRTLGPRSGAVVPQAQPGASGEAARAVLAADTEQVWRNECSRVRARTARAGGGRSARRRACAAGPTAATDRARGTASDKQRRHTNATPAQRRMRVTALQFYECGFSTADRTPVHSAVRHTAANDTLHTNRRDATRIINATGCATAHAHAMKCANR
jgi:hypothetical protein